MPKRLITVVAAALALLPATAGAQDPTATPGPPNRASDEVKLIYEDYGRGKIDGCKHERESLEEALETIEPGFDIDYPDFRVALEAGIERHRDGRCEDRGDNASSTATATATATAEPTASPESGDLPAPEEDTSGAGDGGAVAPPEDGTLPPEDGALPEEGVAPPAPTPAPGTAPPPPPAAAPVTAPTPSPTPAIVTSSRTDNLLLPGLIIAVALLGGLLLVLFAVFGRRSERWEPVWREAAFRTRGTWADFTDWLRLGR